MEESHILPVKWLGTQIMHKILSADKKKRYLCKTKKNPPNYYSINFFISVSPLTIVLAHKQIVFHRHHLSSMSQLMAHTFLSSGCSPSRSKLEIGECAHISICTYYICCPQLSVYIAQMARLQFTNINHKFLQAISNAIIPLVERERKQARRNG